jgi:cytochrome c oxidase subunit 1
MYDERLAKIHFVMAFIGIIFVFIAQHILALYRMPRSVFDYVGTSDLIIMNQIETVRAWIVGVSYLIMLFNMIKTAGKGRNADMKDPFRINEEYYDYTRRQPHLTSST